MDGSVSTLAADLRHLPSPPRDPWTTFLVGLAASVGAGISMGFTEAASDERADLGARLALETRPRLGRDDDTEAGWVTPALSHPRFLDRDDHRQFSSSSSILWATRLDPEPIHADAVLPHSTSGGVRRCTRSGGGHPDWIGLKKARAQGPGPVQQGGMHQNYPFGARGFLDQGQATSR